MNLNETTSNEIYLNEAFKEALKAEAQDEVPVGAIIVYQNKIISKGHNFRETIQNPLSHAEIHALVRASSSLGSWRLESCTLFVTLEPCVMCLGAMSQARIQKCVYGAQDKKGGAISLGYSIHDNEKLNHRFSLEYIPFEKGANILTDFFKKKRENKRKS